jgi:succinate-semialdehyde dehydrogenase/glutarate-semialdehyde dehydrogenase
MAKYSVVNPATGERESEYDAATDQQVRDAITAAADAYRTWSRTTTVAERAALVGRVADLYRERTDELADIIVREMGKPRDQAVGEVEFTADIYQYYADNGVEFLADDPIEALSPGTTFIRRSPLGVILGVMPWNFPYYQVARFAGPNLIVGNTVLLKHASQCPESALAIEKIFTDAGFPAGAYVNVFATAEQVAEIIADPRVQGVSLTGSERAGAAVAELAGRHLKKVVLELGGSDPFILLSTNNLDDAVEKAVAARLDNNGQSCNGAKRFIVIDSLYDDFAAKFVDALSEVRAEDPMKDGTVLGPLSSVGAAAGLAEQVKGAIAKGAKAALGSAEHDGAYFHPVVLTDVTPDNDAFHQEFFGPVAQLYKVSSEDEAVEVANATSFGLGSYLFTTDREQALRVADRIDAGMVYINEVGADSAELPFGGIKNSGTGRELGRLGMEEFVNKKLIRAAAE